MWNTCFKAGSSVPQMPRKPRSHVPYPDHSQQPESLIKRPSRGRHGTRLAEFTQNPRALDSTPSAAESRGTTPVILALGKRRQGIGAEEHLQLHGKVTQATRDPVSKISV